MKVERSWGCVGDEERMRGGAHGNLLSANPTKKTKMRVWRQMPYKAR